MVSKKKLNKLGCTEAEYIRKYTQMRIVQLGLELELSKEERKKLQEASAFYIFQMGKVSNKAKEALVDAILKSIKYVLDSKNKQRG